MMTCQSCQAQLLEYVYGLLDVQDPVEGPAVAELRAHLESCPACQAIHHRALKQQLLLGQASRADTNIVFTSPKAEPRRSLLLRQRSSHISWYITAASLLLALFASMGATYWLGTLPRQQAVETARFELNRLQSQPDDIAPALAKLNEQLQKQQQTIVELANAVKKNEEQTLQQLAAGTTYQQVLTPQSVASNQDARISIGNYTLAGEPAPLAEIDSNLKESLSQNSLSRQKNQQNDNQSNKMTVNIPALAYRDQVGKSLNNEISQDISNKAAYGAIVHPINVEPAKFIAHLCTDKPLYQPGEQVFFRGLALDKANFTPPTEDLYFTFKLTLPDGSSPKSWTKKAQIIDPKTQQPLKDERKQIIQAIGNESWQIPPNTPLGECELTLEEKDGRFDPQSVKFIINKLDVPKLDKQLQFNRPSYAPGDEVVVIGKIKLPNQQPWVHGNVLGQIKVDGKQYNAEGKPADQNLQTTTDATGNLKLSFRLPDNVPFGKGTLALQFQRAEATDDWFHPVRIESSKVYIDCYPEGGDLIAGVSNFVYFQMRNQLGEAIDGEAELLDGKGRFVQKLGTFHDDTEAKASRGMGVFQFTPLAGETYTLKMTKPATAEVKGKLPSIKTSGVTMHIEQSNLASGSTVLTQISNVGKDRLLAICVYCRDVLTTIDQLPMKANQTQTVSLVPNSPLGGVYRVTIAQIIEQNGSRQLQPLAERLIYQQPARTLNLRVDAERTVGRSINLKIDARNETNQPSPAYVTIVGVNKSLLQMAEAVTTRRLPAHFMLYEAIKQPQDLEYADFFLSKHPSASTALDLLLGVQGWRRFIQADDAQAIDRRNNNAVEKAAEKLPVYCFDNRQDVLKELDNKVRARVATSPENTQLQEARKTLETLRADQLQWQDRQSSATASKAREVTIAQTVLQSAQQQWQSFNLWFHATSAAVLGIISLIGLVALLRRRAFLPSHLIYTLGGISLLGLIGTALLWYWQDNSADEVLPMNISKAAGAASPVVTPPSVNPDRMPPAALGTSKSQVKPLPEKLDPSFDKSASAPSPSAPDKEKDTDKALRVAAPTPGTKAEQGDTSAKQKEQKPPQDMPLEKAAPPASSKGATRTTFRNNDVPTPSKTTDSLKVNQLGKDVQAKGLVDNRSQQQTIDQTQTGRKQLSESQKPGANDESKKSAASSNPPANKEGRTEKSDMKVEGGLGGGAGLARGGLGGGGLGGGGFGGSGLGKPTTPGGPPGKSEELLKSMDQRDAYKDLNTQQLSFALREYAWKAEERPGMPALPQVWSKTVYWHPLQIISNAGKLEIPIDLPPGDGVYHFEVFGHDGQGRLGAGYTDVNTENTPVSLRTKLSSTEVKVGETVQLECIVQNHSTRRQPQVIAKITLPQGLRLSPNFKQVRNAVKSAQSDEALEPTKWYVQGNEITLIWAELASGQKVKLTMDLTAITPAGEYIAGASRAYFENQERDADHTAGLAIKIKQ